MGTRFNIRQLRKRAGLTQKELADRVGFRSASIVTMWENGERMPRSEVLPVLSRALGCSVGELYAEAAEVQPPAAGPGA